MAWVVDAPFTDEEIDALYTFLREVERHARRSPEGSSDEPTALIEAVSAHAPARVRGQGCGRVTPEWISPPKAQLHLGRGTDHRGVTAEGGPAARGAQPVLRGGALEDAAHQHQLPPRRHERAKRPLCSNGLPLRVEGARARAHRSCALKFGRVCGADPEFDLDGASRSDGVGAERKEGDTADQRDCDQQPVTPFPDPPPCGGKGRWWCTRHRQLSRKSRARTPDGESGIVDHTGA